MQKGTTHSAEAKDKISAACTGRVVSAETRAKMSAAKRGKPKSPEQRESMRKGQLARQARLRAECTNSAPN